MTQACFPAGPERAASGILSPVQKAALWVAPIALRLALATPFFRSGMTRWDGWFHLSPATPFLFENLFKLHLFGALVGFPWPDAVAHLVAILEIGLPVLLVLGLGTRLAALALLVMTGVIELVVPNGWADYHIHWAAEAIAILALGAGPISLDRAIGRFWPRPEPGAA